MISLIHREQLDVAQYDSCISKSRQSLIYGYSWYMDTVAENWSVLVLDDYEAVMPIPNRKKYTIKYVYPPFWVLQLGIFSKSENIDESEFFDFLTKKFRFIELRLNSGNECSEKNPHLEEKHFQELVLDQSMKIVDSIEYDMWTIL